MARIRTIKPDFWTDEKLTECSLSARLLFIGTWNFADDQGNLPRSAKKIKMQVFPADSFDCEPLIQELLTHGVLTEYSVNEEKYLHIKGFTKHQVINRPSASSIPPPEFNDGSVSGVGGLQEGREGKGKEGSKHIPPKTKPPSAEWDKTEFEKAWAEYPKRDGGNSKTEAAKAWKARTKAGALESEMLAGVRRYAAHCEQKNKVGTEYVKTASAFFGPGMHFQEDWGNAGAGEDWWTAAGFESPFEANNAGCSDKTAYLWKDGHRIQEPA